jgi:hypothetical protein
MSRQFTGLSLFPESLETLEIVNMAVTDLLAQEGA